MARIAAGNIPRTSTVQLIRQLSRMAARLKAAYDALNVHVIEKAR